MRLIYWLMAAVAALSIAPPSAQAVTNKELIEAINAAPLGPSVLAYLVVILSSILLAISLLKRRNR